MILGFVQILTGSTFTCTLNQWDVSLTQSVPLLLGVPAEAEPTLPTSERACNSLRWVA